MLALLVMEMSFVFFSLISLSFLEEVYTQMETEINIFKSGKTLKAMDKSFF